MKRRKYEKPAILWVGYVQSLEVVVETPAASTFELAHDRAVAKARQIADRDASVCVRRSDVAAPNVEYRRKRKLAEVGLCRSDKGVMQIYRQLMNDVAHVRLTQRHKKALERAASEQHTKTELMR